MLFLRFRSPRFRVWNGHFSNWRHRLPTFGNVSPADRSPIGGFNLPLALKVQRDAALRVELAQSVAAKFDCERRAYLRLVSPDGRETSIVHHYDFAAPDDVHALRIPPAMLRNRHPEFWTAYRSPNGADKGAKLAALLSIFQQIVIGVRRLHDSNINHYDLKPNNICLRADVPATHDVADRPDGLVDALLSRVLLALAFVVGADRFGIHPSPISARSSQSLPRRRGTWRRG